MTTLRFQELRRGEVTPKYLADINHLLPQLSSTAVPCNDMWIEEMYDNSTRLFVAIDGDTIVGTVLLVPMVILVGQKDWIEDVVIDEKYRRQGVASALMDMAERASRERGATSINLTSNPDRGGARQMYGERGYMVRDTGVFRLVH
ncbi:MAG: GNAT family N-acetyltransferase [Candidatus Saccharimonadales bacterium]